MNLDRCMKLCALILLLLSIASVLITAVIVSSDTLDIVQDVPNIEQGDNIKLTDAENDNNGKQTNSETNVETLDIVIPNTNNNEYVVDENVGDEVNNPNLDEFQNRKQSEPEISIDGNQIPSLNPESQIFEPTEQNIDTEDASDNNQDAVPSVPAASSSITTGEETKEIFIEKPLVDKVENILEMNVDSSNDTHAQHQQQQQMNTSEIPAVNLVPDNQLEKQDEQPMSGGAVSPEENEDEPTITVAPIELNLTEENQIPVFSEWAQKRLEEVEKEVEQEVVNTSTMKKNLPSAHKPQVLKLKSAKNYASPDCGAKIIAANSESSGTGYVLTSGRDEYMLSPCKSRIWFVVELCEAIQAERIDLANFELFSSSPKNFSVAVSSRFPTRDWTNVGKFVAKDERYIQNFDLNPHLFGKYVRVDVHSHYNSEHFCPISLFRVYGTSEFEAFETENRPHPIDDLDVDDEDEPETETTTKGKTNLFQSASDAVMSIVDTVKKAASFVKPNGNKTTDSTIDNSLNASNSNCITPNYPINCENCTDEMKAEVNAITECKQQLLNRLLSIAIIRNSLYKSHICASLIGSDLIINCNESTIDANNNTSKQLTDLQVDYITHLFSLKYITAMCNLLAVNDRRYVWNSTVPVQTEPSMINVTIDKNANDILSTTEKKTHKTPTTKGSIRKISENAPKIEIDETISILEDKDSTDHNDNFKPLERNTLNEDTMNVEDSTSAEQIVVASSGENLEQNIFNAVEPNDAKIVEQPSLETVETVTTATEPDVSQENVEQATPPNVIILPDSASGSTTTTTTTPNSVEMNEVNDEHATNTQQYGHKFHSESVFLRLSNRIKALERNMSLSGQYLEELSRGYKKQVEELQSSFAKTLLNIEEQNRKSTERKQELLAQNQKLRNELEILTERIFSWKNILLCCACFTCVQIVIFHIILLIWGRKYGLERSPSIDVNAMIEKVDTMPRKRKTTNVPVKMRRKSAEEKRERTISESSAQALQRRPSTEALNIVGTYTELLIDETNSSKNDHSPQNEELRDDDVNGYVRIEDLRNMNEKPENDYEYYGPALESKSNHSDSPIIDYGGSITTLDSSIENSSPKPKKSAIKNSKNKNRRLSSPSFFKSPFSGGSTAQSTGWEWHRSKKFTKSSQVANKKSKSESPPPPPPSTILNQNGLKNNSMKKSSSPSKRKNSNGIDDDELHIPGDSARSSISTATIEANDRKTTTGSFKRLLKKIF